MKWICKWNFMIYFRSTEMQPVNSSVKSSHWASQRTVKQSSSDTCKIYSTLYMRRLIFRSLALLRHNEKFTPNLSWLLCSEFTSIKGMLECGYYLLHSKQNCSFSDWFPFKSCHPDFTYWQINIDKQVAFAHLMPLMQSWGI